MIRLRTVLLGAALMLGACGAEAEADALVQVANGPVIDTADLLPAAEEADLDRRLREYWDKEETAIVVSTVNSLDNRTIEDFARSQYSKLGIGSARTNRGVLVLVALTERKARIEVGCGLETVLTNEVAQQIMDQDSIPEFRDGEFVGGVTAVVDGIEAALAASDVAPGPVSPYCVELMREAA